MSYGPGFIWFPLIAVSFAPVLAHVEAEQNADHLEQVVEQLDVIARVSKEAARMGRGRPEERYPTVSRQTLAFATALAFDGTNFSDQSVAPHGLGTWLEQLKVSSPWSPQDHRVPSRLERRVPVELEVYREVRPLGALEEHTVRGGIELVARPLRRFWAVHPRDMAREMRRMFDETAGCTDLEARSVVVESLSVALDAEAEEKSVLLNLVLSDGTHRCSGRIAPEMVETHVGFVPSNPLKIDEAEWAANFLWLSPAALGLSPASARALALARRVQARGSVKLMGLDVPSRWAGPGADVAGAALLLGLGTLVSRDGALRRLPHVVMTVVAMAVPLGTGLFGVALANEASGVRIYTFTGVLFAVAFCVYTLLKAGRGPDAEPGAGTVLKRVVVSNGPLTTEGLERVLKHVEGANPSQRTSELIVVEAAPEHDSRVSNVSTSPEEPSA